MADIDEPGDNGDRGPAGAESRGPSPGDELDDGVGGAAPDDDGTEAPTDQEILDEADMSAAIDDAFADDDPLALALNQRDEYLDSLRRLQAEFENYKKRVQKQQADQSARAAMSLVEKVLPVLDTLDLATQHLQDADSEDGRALAAVAGQLVDVLSKEGLERIEPLGEEFDPTAHEAVGHLPPDEPEGAATEDEAGEGSAEPVVGQVMRAGYRWRGTVVRPAMVMVRG